MKKKTMFILICILFITGFTFKVPPVRALLRDQTISTVAEKDTYVNSYEPSSNYGAEDHTIAGDFLTSYEAESYFFFSFSDKPNNYTEAEISLYCGLSDILRNVSICLIEEQWEEFSMNWTNKPSKGTEIASLLITQTDIYKLNVTNYIAGRNNISICVYIKSVNDVDKNVVITSREGYFSPESAPQLIWTYPENAEITVTSPTSSSIWVDSDSYSIQWTSIGKIEDVKIELYNGTTFVENLTSVYGYTENDGEYNFYISPTDHYKGRNYRIKISDYDDPNVFAYSDNFSINVGSGTIAVYQPSNSDSWHQGSSHTIRWNTTGTIINVDIEIYKGGTLKQSIDDRSNFGFYSWSIDSESEPGTDWRVKVINSDNSSQYDWSEYFEIIPALGPPIPGYNSYIILNLIFIISIIAIRKIKK